MIFQPDKKTEAAAAAPVTPHKSGHRSPSGQSSTASRAAAPSSAPPAQERSTGTKTHRAAAMHPAATTTALQRAEPTSAHTDGALGPHVPTLASPAKQAFHVVVCIAGWALFVYWWQLVMLRVTPEELRFTAFFLSITFMVCVAITTAWSVHNLAISKRRGPRTQVRQVPEEYSRDRLGRAVTFKGSAEDLKRDSVVQIRLEHEGKVYRPSSSMRKTKSAANAES